MVNKSLIRKINAKWQEHLYHERKSIAACIETGKLLIQAREKTEHGAWKIWVENNTPDIGYSTVKKIMTIAGYERFSKVELIPLLPTSWGTLHEVYLATKDMTEVEFEHAVHNNIIHNEMTVTDASCLRRRDDNSVFNQKIKEATPRRISKITFKLGDCLDVMKGYEDNTFDSIVTDPPYGIEFLGTHWDKNVPTTEVWQECLRVLKPAGYLLAFGSPKTYHRLATAIEDAGFEIKDSLMWIYYSGFPRGVNIEKAIQKQHGVSIESQQWSGFNTNLKPAHEPIVMARKPLSEKTYVENIRKWGTGALNIDDSMIDVKGKRTYPANGMNRLAYGSIPNKWDKTTVTTDSGKYPANVISEVPDHEPYFYCPKADTSERNFGLGSISPDGSIPDEGEYASYNNHPCVKPASLIQYLVKLVTPPSGNVLDPFFGSGSSALACVLEGIDLTGIEIEEEFLEIAKSRVKAVQSILEIRKDDEVRVAS